MRNPGERRGTFFTLLLPIVLLLLPAPTSAQRNETLAGEGIRSGGFGGPVVKLTEIHGDFGVFVGGRGGWIINSTFIIGGGGYGLADTNIEVDRVDALGRPLTLGMGYGGLELEYVSRSRKLVHFTVQALIGAGGITYVDRAPRFDTGVRDDAFFITEPGFNVEVNVTDFFRIGFGASYRFVAAVDLPGVTEDDLAGASGMVTFKFGSF